MNNNYPTIYTKKDSYKNRQYNNRKKYYHKRNQYNNNYKAYYKSKKTVYDIYEDEFSYEKETNLSTKAPSTNDGSSQSSNSNSSSRKQSFCDNINNNNYNCENNKDSNFLFIENKKLEKPKIDNIPKIDLSENELKTAYFKPKNYKEKEESITNKENQNKNANITILEITVKISENKSVDFKLRKYDDMFQVIKETCKENEIDEYYINFFAYTIIKALNSIYGIVNLKLKEDEIRFLYDLKEKFNDV